MISFTLSLVALVLGYLVYGKFVAHVFGPDDRPTPAITKADGVDFVVLPSWKIFMIQFLNIAGTGPIFGAIMGAWYGPVAYLWIVLGCIFAGAMHDYLSGMLSIRNDGAGLPELVGKYLGVKTKKVLLVVTLFLLVMVGAVFAYSPAIILDGICNTDMFLGGKMFWIIVIFIYYIIATLLPINKIIGKVYPVFAFSLIFMAIALMVGLFVKWPALPEIWSNLSSCNLNENPAWLGTESYIDNNPIFPCLFITISCGAISGFHATQSPLMSRCLKSEKMGRPVFYGAMVTEGIVALIWATLSIYFFYYGGWRECVSPEVAQKFIAQVEGGKSLIQNFDAPTVVEIICSSWLGNFGGILALLGVVAAPISTGDTALRSARLIIADFASMEQRSLRRRLYISLPLFAVTIGILVWQMANPYGFNIIWQYIGWANQTLSVFTLWTLTVYFVQRKKPFIVTLIPALFMTCVCSTFFLVSKQTLGLQEGFSYTCGCLVTVVALVCFFAWYIRLKRNNEKAIC